MEPGLSRTPEAGLDSHSLADIFGRLCSVSRIALGMSLVDSAVSEHFLDAGIANY